MDKKVPILFQFVSDNRPGSIIIRWFTWSHYSHVDLVLPSKKDYSAYPYMPVKWHPEGALLGARFHGGVKIRPHNYCKFSRIALATKMVTEHEAEILYRSALGQIGKPYDIMAIVAFAIHDRDWENTAKWFCSELAAWLMKKIGYPLLNTQFLYRLTPRDDCISPVWDKLEVIK